jgi:EAL domain-containing protein (putative c-di-GMP-specific phosphodiesterase class I)
VDTKSGRPVSAEALVRIRKPEGGLLMPSSFLTVAHERGLLIQIDKLVLADARLWDRRWCGPTHRNRPG